MATSTNFPHLRALRVFRTACLLVPFILAIAFGMQAWHSERDQAVAIARKNSDLIQQYMLRMIEAQMALMDRVDFQITNDLLAQDRTRVHMILRDLVQRSSFVEHLGIVEADGRIRVSSTSLALIEDVTDRAYYRALRTGGHDVFVDRIVIRPSGRDALVVSKRRAGDEFNGMIAAVIPIELVNDYFSTLGTGPGSSASIIRADGRLLVRTDARRGPIDLPPEVPARVAMATGSTGVYQATAISDGLTRIYGFAQIGDTNLFGHYGVATTALWRDWAAKTVPLGALLMFAGVLGAVAATQAIRRSEAEAQGLEASKLHQTFFDNHSDALFVISVQSGRLVLDSVNKAGLALDPAMGVESLRHPLGRFMPPAASERLEAECRRAMAERGTVRYEWERDFGRGPRRLETVLAPVIDEGGRVTQIVGATRDVTERARLEEELRHAQKNEALSRLVSGVAHDFNNILHVVLANLDMLERAKEDRRSRLVDNARRAAEQGRKITGQLLSFGQRQRLAPEVVDLNLAIAAMDDMLAQSLRGDIVVTLDLEPELWRVEVDVAQLKTSIINIAANARDAMPDGGRFTIRTQNVFHRDGKSTEAVAIDFTDTGDGMSPAQLARLGEPFFTTKKEAGRGNGLGLAQVFGFVRQSGGSVDVRSEPGRGTSIGLMFPRTVREPEPASREAAAIEDQEEREVVRPLSILLVEDNPEVVQAASDTLVGWGHRVILKRTADEAVALLEAWPDVDLVLSDIVMPGHLDGVALARLVRERHADCPVILMTGYSELADQARSEGFAILGKPYASSMLRAAIREAMGRSDRVRADNVVRLRMN